MLKYYEYLIKIKSFLFTEYKLDIFSNINEFPIQLDKTTHIGASLLQRYLLFLLNDVVYRAFIVFFEFTSISLLRLPTNTSFKNVGFQIHTSLFVHKLMK